jgi:hypothetical protein
LPGASVSEAWRRTLKQPELFISRTPEAFMSPVRGQRDTRSLTDYLARRYWAGDPLPA